MSGSSLYVKHLAPCLLVLNDVCPMTNSSEGRDLACVSWTCSVDIGGLSASTMVSINLFILNFIFLLSLGPRNVQ